jgi:ABC-type branched-subunit amino acid transport system substrate-binding protein
MNARSIGALLAGTVLSVGAIACGSDKGGGGSSAASSGEPLTVALIPPSAGPLAEFGTSAVNAWQLAADEVNAKGGVDGHPVKIVKLESDGSPAGTLRAARKAVTHDGAKYFSGIVTSGENAALAPQLAALGAVDIVSMSKDDSLTGSVCSPNLFRTTISSGMDVTATAKVLADLPAKRWALLMSDILTGHTAAKQFTAEAAKHGKEIVSTQFDPLGTTEYGSYITKIKDSGADALYVFASGADGVAFVKQAEQFKLFDQVKTVVGFSTVSEPVFDAMGDTILGFYNNLNYSWNFDNALNKTFAASYEKKYGTKPWFIPAENYIAAQFLFNAVRKAKSVDVEKVKTAMNGLSFDTISGPFEMRAGDHQAVRDTFVGQIVDESGQKGWKVIKTVPSGETTPTASGDCTM